MRIIYTILVGLLMLGTFEHRLYSQAKADIHFFNIQKADGLSNNTVNDIVKDNLGFIWIATNDGLCRYDGPNQIKVFRAENKEIPNGLQSSNIRTLFFDSEENLWIGTRLGGLTRYHPSTGTWKTFRHNADDAHSLSNDEVLTIIEDSHHRLWIGTEGGLNLYDYKSETFTNFLPNKKKPNSLSARAVLSVMEDAKGWIWIGTWAGGLDLLLTDEKGRIREGQFRNFQLKVDKPANNVWSTYQDKQKRYWIATHGGGLFLMQLPKNASNFQNKQHWTPQFHNSKESEDKPNSLSSNHIQEIHQDIRGKLWISTLNGLNYIEEKDLPDAELFNIPTTKSPFLNFGNYNFDPNDANSIASNHVTTIYEDEQGLLWFASNSGISLYNWYTSQFEIYDFFRSSHKSPDAQYIFVDANQVAWLAAGDKGLITYDFQRNEGISISKNYSELLVDEFASSVYSPDKERLFVGNRTGVSLIDLKALKSKHFPTPEWLRKQAGNFFIQKIFVDHQQMIWLATQEGLFSIEPQTGEYSYYGHHLDNAKTISDNSINDITQDKAGNLWIATYNGLNRSRIGPNGLREFERFYHKSHTQEKSIISNQVTALKVIGSKLYIGTTAGLCRYDLDSKKFENFPQSNNKFWVQSIEPTSNGDFWASTTEGVFHFNAQEKTFNIFDKSDGMSDISFRVGASSTDEEGFLYFGSRLGVTRLHPNRIVHNTLAPPIHITNIQIMNPERATNLSGIYQKEVILEHNDYYLSINFAALNYNRGQKNQYAYKLEGFDKEWKVAEFGMPAVYTNLKPHKYTFRVKAANNDGFWNEEGVSLTINKKAAFWETWWFLAICIIVGSLLASLVVSNYTQKVRKRNLSLKAYNDNLNKEIEERERFEKALKNREQFLRLIMDNVPQYIYWVDKKYRYLGGNKAYLQFLNLESEAELKGKHISDFAALSEHINKRENYLNKVLETKAPIYNHILKLKGDIQYAERFFIQNYIPLLNEGGATIGMLVTGEEISSRIKHEELIKEKTEKLKEFNEELRRSNKDLEQFAYIASHDLKEPLRTIGNFSGLLARAYKSKLDQDAFEYISFIEDGVRRMSNLINSLLTYSRVGRKEAKFKEIDLQKIVEKKIFDLSQVIKDRNAKISLGSLPIIYGEKEQIGMVFYNLINNSIKFNKNEQPTVVIKSHEDGPEGYWKFSVKDNGIGIAPKYQDQIFEIFRRLHGKREYEGTGIGLSVCQKIVFRHEGKIWFESFPGQGTTFFFTISKNKGKQDKKEAMKNKKTIVGITQN